MYYLFIVLTVMLHKSMHSANSLLMLSIFGQAGCGSTIGPCKAGETNSPPALGAGTFIMVLCAFCT